ncbi:hypothetical protein [Gemmatimonas sp.]|uniref:hypothetical protein n=1 Tax=Gemmatimonas sp. TaxID=1962908 RepID=UPI00286C5501|nr:hypothetical protein [Gemmatimonas sp.]
MTTDRVAPNRMVRALLGFTAAQVTLVVVAAYVMQRFVWTDPASAGAVRASAWLAVIVQTFTFAIAMLVARTQVMAGWGLGVLLRGATLAFWAFLGAEALGLPSSPALVSLVVFYFVSTVIEPIFLNVH